MDRNLVDPCMVSQLSTETLRQEIQKRREAYSRGQETDLSDTSYEFLCRELGRREPNDPLLEQVGPAVAGAAVVHYEKPMLSLDKVFTKEEIEDWAARCGLHEDDTVFLMPKYDGMASRYTGKVLSTKTDPYSGYDVTDKLPMIQAYGGFLGSPLGSFPEASEEAPVFGELIIGWSQFRNRFNNLGLSKSGQEYKTPRNAVVGLMGANTDPEVMRKMQAANAYISFVPYESARRCITVYKLLRDWDEIVRFFEEFADTVYPCDGIVIRVQDPQKFAALGFTSHHPKGAVAFKFSDEVKQTKLLRVEFTVGRQQITPTAVMEPVQLGGVTVSRAKLHNWKNILDKDIQIGDMLVVKRSGDVIPYVLDRIPGEDRHPVTYDLCPGCGFPVLYREPNLVCVNRNCPENLVQSLLNTSRVFGIDDLAEETIRKLVASARVRNWYDILILDDYEFDQYTGVGPKVAAKIIDRLSRSRYTTADVFLAAMGIPLIGKEYAYRLMQAYDLYTLRLASVEEIAALPNFGEARATSVVNWLKQNKALLLKLEAIMTLDYPPRVDTSLPEICFTGKMPQSRKYYEEMAIKRGYRISGAVGKSTNLLVTAEPDATSDKAKKAAKYGVRTILLDEWLKEIEK